MDKRSQYISNDSNNDRSAYVKGNVGTGSPVVFSVVSATPAKESTPANNDQNAQKLEKTSPSPTTSLSMDDALKYPKKSVLEIDIKKAAAPQTVGAPDTAKGPSATRDVPETQHCNGRVEPKKHAERNIFFDYALSSTDQSPTSSSKVKNLIDFYENKSSPSSSPSVKRTGKSWSPKSLMTPISSKSVELEKQTPSSQLVIEDDAKKTSAEANSSIVSPKDKKSDSFSPVSHAKVIILAEDNKQTTKKAESSNKSGEDGHVNITGKPSTDEEFACKNIVILFLAVLILILLTFAICAK
uniref:Uncharacterized protein n=1 Tax=Romanomermis culicivorax TaxID=13658 RepID=A0A915HGV4_ROMCU